MNRRVRTACSFEEVQEQRIQCCGGSRFVDVTREVGMFLGEAAAYRRMFAAAYEFGGGRVREIANDLTFEAREACIGIATADRDRISITMPGAEWVPKIVLDILVEINKEVRQ